MYLLRLGYIFESSLLDTLLKLSPNPAFRNVAFQCLAEIGGLNVESKYDSHFVKLYITVMTQLQQILPRGEVVEVSRTHTRC